MKQLLLILTVISLVSCNEQRDTYLIQGNLKDIPDGTLIGLWAHFGQTGTRISLDTIIDGKFKFNGTLKERPSKMSLRFSDRQNYYGSCELWVDHELIEIHGTSKYPSSWMVKGSNKELAALNAIRDKTRKLVTMKDSLRLLIKHSPKGEDSTELLWDAIDSIDQIRNDIEFKTIEKNPNSLSALEILYGNVKFDSLRDIDQIKKIYNKLDTTYQTTLYGEGILSIIQEKNIPEVGDKMTNFVAYDTEGKKHHLAHFKGKYILLDFWSLACLPCRQAVPETKNIHVRNQEILTIIGVSMDTNEDLWKEASQIDNISWVNLFDGKGGIAGVGANYGIKGFPTYFLIDPNGIIIDKWLGYKPNGLHEKLSQHIENLEF